jgi:hypothetical protein
LVDQPTQLGALGHAQLVGAVDQLGQLGEEPGAGGGVPLGSLGLWQMTNRSASLILTSLTRRLPATSA